MKFFNFINGVKKDKHLRFIFFLFIQFLEDGSDNIFMHLLLGIHDLIIILNSFKRDLLIPQFFLNQLADVEFYDIFRMFLVER